MKTIKTLIIPTALLISMGAVHAADADPSGYKSKDPDSVVRETTDPGMAADAPTADADPSGYKEGGQGTDIRQTADPGMAADAPAADADPSGYKSRSGSVGAYPFADADTNRDNMLDEDEYNRAMEGMRGEMERMDAEITGFKSQDKSRLIRESATPDDTADFPDDDADPTGFKSKDSDSIVRETVELDEGGGPDDVDAEPTGFKSKDQSRIIKD